MTINSPSQLSDADLVALLKSCAWSEREATVHLVAHLAEFDARRLYLPAGFSSLFTYSCEILRLSEAESYNRIEAARAVQKFPVILDLLGKAALNLTTVRLLAQHLTSENHERLLAAASGRSKREVEELLARHFPRPDVPSSVRKLPVPRPMPLEPPPGAPPASATDAGLPCSPGNRDVPALVFAAPGPPASHVRPSAPPPSVRRPLVTPLAADRFAIQFTVGTETRDKLRLAQDLLRHAIPTGDAGEIFDRALTLLLDDLARKKFAATRAPRKGDGVTGDARKGAEASHARPRASWAEGEVREATALYGRVAKRATRSGESWLAPWDAGSSSAERASRTGV